jgi:putative membrane protein
MNNSKAKQFIGVLTIAVMGLVFLMYSGFGVKTWFDSSFPGFDKSKLPFLNALLNSLVFICLLSAFRAIKSKNIALHRRFIYIACVLSTLFLLNYVFYHMISETTKFGGEGFIKLVYLVVLLTHVVLAAVSFPFIVYTAFLGQTMQVESHRKLAKFVFPVWLYVAFTGVIVYFMISPYYQH